MKKQDHAAMRGFTLIEVMVVMGIITLIVVMGIFTYLSTVRDSRLRADVRDLSQTLQLAKMRAIASGMGHGVAFVRPNHYFIFVDCVQNSSYDDPDNNPDNNSPVPSWDQCIALTYDPRLEGQAVKELSDGNYFGSIIGTTAPGATPLEYVLFNRLGQAVQGNSFVSRTNPINIEYDDPDTGLKTRSGVEIMGASGISNVVPLTRVGS